MSTADHRPVSGSSPPPLWEALLTAGGLLLLLAGVLWWVVLAPRNGKEARIATVVPTAEGLLPGDAYIGSAACRECHPGASALYAGSGHARTLRPVTARRIARELDGRVVTDPEHPEVTWTYRLRDGRLEVERAEGGASRAELIEYAFGSGHHATTFISLLEGSPPAALEHRLTYFAHSGDLGITPGQRKNDELPESQRLPHGRLWSPEEAVRCFACHATRTSAHALDALDTTTMIPNVSCERCHGPGRAHVEAVRRGEPDPSLTNAIIELTADQEMLLCGQCHRHPSMAPPGKIRPDNPELARFQPVGLMQSKCFTDSNGAMRCVTCHDPHARAESDPAVYEATCLQCHQAASQSTCPVSARDGCIDCHMPAIDAGQDILFTDHWIRVREPVAPGHPPESSASRLVN